MERQHSHTRQSFEDSYLQPPRSRADSGVSSTDDQFNNLALVDSPRSLLFNLSRPASSTGTHSPSFISPAPPSSTTFLSTPSTQSSWSPNFPVLPLPLSGIRPAWSESHEQYHETPLVCVDPAEDYCRAASSLPRTTTTTGTMSTVAINYDSRFDLGVPRSSFTWPVLESGSDFLGHDLSSINHGSDISLTPPPSGSRSVTQSPPRGTMTPEQRELKRQRDHARRESKSSVRARRAMSSSMSSTYSSAHSPPMTMAEFSSVSTLPIYSTSPAQISLLAEPVTTMSSPYVPAYSTSPLPDQHMFSPHFSPMSNSGYMGMDYNAGFPHSSTSQGLGSHYGRPTSIPETSMLYQVPVLPSGNSPVQEGGHVRVVQSRPKPQCWEHGCNGRQFSTFSNLLRHQREKSGQATKATCPNCGAEFTRTTARNGHLAHDKCKQRRNS